MKAPAASRLLLGSGRRGNGLLRRGLRLRSWPAPAQIGHQVVAVLDAGRIADEALGATGVGAFLLGQLDVAGGAQRSDEGADRTGWPPCGRT